MASIQQNGSNTTAQSTKNVGGAAINIGSSTTLVDNVGLGGSNVGVFGSVVVRDTITANDYAAVASSGSNNFAFNNQSPITMKYTTSIAGTGNAFLQSGANVPSLTRSIHKLETVRTRRLTTAIRAGEWNIYTGQFANDPTVAVDNWWSIGDGATSVSSTDDSANPSREVPGELTFKLGLQTPVSVDYKPKNS